MDSLYVVPARDADGNACRVPDPATGDPLPPEGAFKPRTQYWLRRIAHSDVTETAPPQIPQKPSAPADGPQSRKAKG